MKEESQLFKVQKELSLFFIIALFPMFIINSYMLYVDYGFLGFLNLKKLGSYYLIIFFVLIICNFLSFLFDTKWAKVIQSLMFLFQSFFILIESLQNGEAWGFWVISILLMWKYGLLKKNLMLKFILLYIGFFMSCVISLFTQKLNPSILLSETVYFLVVLIFFLIIIKDDIYKISKDKKKILLLQDEIKFLKEEIEVLKVSSANNDDIKMPIPLNNKNLSNIQDKLLSNKSIDDIRNKILQVSDFNNCTQRELEVIILFYASRGILSNKEIGSYLNISETSVKNIMRNIFKKIDTVKSRAELIAYTEDQMPKTTN